MTAVLGGGGFWASVAKAVAPVVATAVAIVKAPVVIAAAVVVCVAIAGVAIYNHFSTDTVVDVPIPDVAPPPDTPIDDIVEDVIAFPIAPPVSRVYLYEGVLNPPHGGLTEEEQAAYLQGGMAALLALQAAAIVGAGVNTIADNLHANNRRSQRPNHGYEIFLINNLDVSRIPLTLYFRYIHENNFLKFVQFDEENSQMIIPPNRVKVGISDNRYLNKNGTSQRANRQVNSFNRSLKRDEPSIVYNGKVVKHFGNRQ